MRIGCGPAARARGHSALLRDIEDRVDAEGHGACFINSGGPVLWYGANTIAAVQTFGMHGNCKGISGAYRIYRTDDLDFIRQFL